MVGGGGGDETVVVGGGRGVGVGVVGNLTVI